MSVNDAKGKPLFLHAGQLPYCYAMLWRAGIPCNVVGPVGSGKTLSTEIFWNWLNEKAKAAGRALYRYWKLIMSVSEPTDMGGYPVPRQVKEKWIVEHIMAQHMDFFDTDVPGLVVADEFDRGKPDTQNTYLQMLLTGEINGHKMSPKAYMIMTMNGESDIYTNPLSAAARTRMCHLYVNGNQPGAMESWQNWAMETNVHPIVRGFKKFRPDLVTYHDNFEELAICTDRTLVMAGQLLYAAAKCSFDTSEILLPCLAGTIGKVAALEMWGFKDMFDKCPDVDDILKTPETTALPEDATVMAMLGMALVSRVTEKDRDTAVAVMKYMARGPVEPCAFTTRLAAERCPSLVATAEYQDWCEENKQVLM